MVYLSIFLYCWVYHCIVFKSTSKSLFQTWRHGFLRAVSQDVLMHHVTYRCMMGSDATMPALWAPLRRSKFEMWDFFAFKVQKCNSIEINGLPSLMLLLSFPPYHHCQIVGAVGWKAQTQANLTSAPDDSFIDTLQLVSTTDSTNSKQSALAASGQETFAGQSPSLTAFQTGRCMNITSDH